MDYNHILGRLTGIDRVQSKNSPFSASFPALPGFQWPRTCPCGQAHAEGINGIIERIKNTARGYRNRENFKTAILFFHCGGLRLDQLALGSG